MLDVAQCYGIDISPIVLCDTRKIGDSEEWKNSYHVHFREIVFKNNHDHEIKNFVREVLQGLQGPYWVWTNPKNGKQTHVVDICVYRKFGLFRVAGCGKNSSCLQELDIATGELNAKLSLETWSSCLVCVNDENLTPTVRMCHAPMSVCDVTVIADLNPWTVAGKEEHAQIKCKAQADRGQKN